MDVIAMCSQYFNTIYIYSVHVEESWDQYEYRESNHIYNQGKTLLMVVSKGLLSTYHLDLDQKKEKNKL
jgi:hypothetical protein